VGRGPGREIEKGELIQSSAMDHAELLSTIPMFEDLGPDDLAALAKAVVPRRCAAGQMIIQQGEAGTSMFIVVDGNVNIHLPGEQSRRISLKDIAAGEYFGELALFDDKPRSASAVATTDALLLELDRATLSSYLAARPHAAMVLLSTLAGRLRATNEMLSQRAAKNAVQEVESKLTWSQRLADKVAELNGSWAFILILLGVTALWFAVNSVAIQHGSFDPYPYVFFNLLLAILVSLQGPLIVMSQNRSAIKDRAQAETDFQVNLKNEVNIETLLRELGELRTETAGRLDRIERVIGKE
jgi:CRP/FNR family transcriptional regulator, cyclic AMP receptor protein